MHNRKIDRFQGQIETALKKFAGELDLRMKDLFAKLRTKSHAAEVVKNYQGRWSIEVFFKEAKQRLGLGQEQAYSFAAQYSPWSKPSSTTTCWPTCWSRTKNSPRPSAISSANWKRRPAISLF